MKLSLLIKESCNKYDKKLFHLNLLIYSVVVGANLMGSTSENIITSKATYLEIMLFSINLPIKYFAL